MLTTSGYSRDLLIEANFPTSKLRKECDDHARKKLTRWRFELAYRAAFTIMEQTAPLTKRRVQVPVVAHGGEEAQGGQIRKMVEMIAENVDGGSIADCGHFVPEERPDEIVRHILAMTK
jgi:pimeloyl-ACP methyl ester carboxylesterase